MVRPSTNTCAAGAAALSLPRSGSLPLQVQKTQCEPTQAKMGSSGLLSCFSSSSLLLGLASAGSPQQGAAAPPGTNSQPCRKPFSPGVLVRVLRLVLIGSGWVMCQALSNHCDQGREQGFPLARPGPMTTPGVGVTCQALSEWLWEGQGAEPPHMTTGSSGWRLGQGGLGTRKKARLLLLGGAAGARLPCLPALCPSHPCSCLPFLLPRSALPALSPSAPSGSSSSTG